MKICGIIAEYHPFHNGHRYQIEESRRLGATHIIAVMSGNFVQRGEPALFSKWVRAEACLHNGVDLVVELPTPFAMAPAREFASAGIFLLGQLGASMLSFGSELGEAARLQTLSDFCEKAEKSEEMERLLKEGVSHAKARELAVERLFGSEWGEEIRKPNNLLGVEYLRAIKRFGYEMEGVTIGRKGALHDGEERQDGIASASWLRQQILEHGLSAAAPFLPENTLKLYERALESGEAPCTLKRLEQPLFYALRKMSCEEIGGIADVEQGMERRIKRGSEVCCDLEELIEFLKNRRYTRARVRRVLLNCLLSVPKRTFCLPQYLRVLGMNGRGMEILKRAKTLSRIPVSPKFAALHRQGFAQAELEVRSTDIYGLSAPRILPGKREFTEQTIVLTACGGGIGTYGANEE